MRARVALQVQVCSALLALHALTTAVSAVQCRNYGGAAGVDRWVVYNLGPTKGWWYWDETLPGAPRYYQTDPLMDVNNPVRHTINQARTVAGVPPPPTVEYIHFGEADGASAGTIAVDTATNAGMHQHALTDPLTHQPNCCALLCCAVPGWAGLGCAWPRCPVGTVCCVHEQGFI
jgi:hypothetical protein